MSKVERRPLEYSGIFYDSANLDEFRKWFETSILGGATTNPVLFQKEGILDVTGHIDKMIEIAGENFPISIEIPDTAMEKDEMVKLALKYKEKYPTNAVIKVPMDPRYPQKAFEVIYQLGQEGVRVNATIGVSMGQLVGAAEALRLSKVDGNNYISLFWGRREEAKKQIVEAEISRINEEATEKEKRGLTEEEIATIRERLDRQVPDAAATLAMTLNYLRDHSLATRVIIGSIRNVGQIEQAFNLGADIVTISPKLLEEWMVTQRGIETADQFNKAYRDVKDKMKLI